MKRNILFAIIFIAGVSFIEQRALVTEDSEYIFWQPNRQITYSDFKGDTTKEGMDFFRKYETKAMAYVGIWSILDVPKKKKDRGKKLEKVYFAPAFCKTTSFAIANDTLQIAIQAVYFDICEFATRLARKKLHELQEKMNGYGTLYFNYATVEKDIQEKRKELNASYTKEVIVEKKPGAYESWRKFYDEMLDKTKEWATTPEECFRLLSKRPIEPDYEKSPTVLGAMK